MLIPDMFTGELRPPEQCAGHVTDASGFIAFWEAWPAGPRKVAKAQCLAKWARLGCAQHTAKIVLHVEWLKTQKDWLEGFICAPLVYLNQARWLDWEIVEPVKAPKMDPALAKLDQDAKQAAPMPKEVRERLAQIRGQA